MPTQYNGIPSNLNTLVPVAALNIASSTNTNPIQVVTSTPHGLKTGDDVLIYGHQTNTSANGRWPITFINSITFSIPVAGVAIGGGTGKVQPLTMGPTFQIPSDGDDFDAAAFDVPYEALGDRTAFNYEYVFPVVEWGSVKRAPLRVADRASATPYHANPGIASIYQFETQTVGFSIVMDIASYPPLSGQTMTFVINSNSVGLNIFNEGGSDGAILSSTGATITFRYNASLGFWKIISAATIDATKMIFSNPF